MKEKHNLANTQINKGEIRDISDDGLSPDQDSAQA